jgi:hypothetical protein
MGVQTRRMAAVKAGLGVKFEEWYDVAGQHVTAKGKPISSSGLDNRADREWSDSRIEALLAGIRAERQDRWLAVAREVPDGRRCKQVQLYEWVAEHLRSEPEACDRSRIPSVAAVNRLLTALESESSLNAFWKDYQQATKERDEKVDLQLRIEEDCDELAAFCEKLEKACVEAGI